MPSLTGSHPAVACVTLPDHGNDCLTPPLLAEPSRALPDTTMPDQA